VLYLIKNGMHAIFVSKEMLDRDPEFEESLLDKAQKQQDLVTENHVTGHFGVVSY
jgi:hypothetical protein